MTLHIDIFKNTCRAYATFKKSCNYLNLLRILSSMMSWFYGHSNFLFKWMMLPCVHLQLNILRLPLKARNGLTRLTLRSPCTPRILISEVSVFNIYPFTEESSSYFSCWIFATTFITFLYIFFSMVI